MDWRSVRDGLLAYENYEKSLKLIAGESLFIAVMVAAIQESLNVGIGTFFVSLMLWYLPIIGTFMVVVFSACYAYIGCMIVSMVSGSIGVGIIIAIFIFMASIGLHSYSR